MNNPLISAIMGKPTNGHTPLVESSDVVPVPGGGITRKSYRDRLVQLRRRRGEDEEGNPLSLESSDVAAVLGEAKGDVIPDDAEELNKSELPGTVTTKLNPIKDVVEEPGRPRDPDEVFISPKSALTAPDATPDSMTPSDPSNLPGVEKTSFTVPQVVTRGEELPAEEAPEAATKTGMDTATRTMDLLLGRRRVGAPAKKAEEYAMTGAVTTEAQALSMLGMGKGGDTLLAQGQEMPAPAAGDGKTIYESARRWM